MNHCITGDCWFCAKERSSLFTTIYNHPAPILSPASQSAVCYSSYHDPSNPRGGLCRDTLTRTTYSHQTEVTIKRDFMGSKSVYITITRDIHILSFGRCFHPKRLTGKARQGKTVTKKEQRVAFAMLKDLRGSSTEVYCEFSFLECTKGVLADSWLCGSG